MIRQQGRELRHGFNEQMLPTMKFLAIHNQGIG